MSYIVDPRSAACLATVHEQVKEVAINFLSAIAESNRLPNGFVAKVIQGTRSYEEQAALYAQGRTAPGARVTNAPPGYSWHNFGVAFDLGIFTPQDNYYDDENSVQADRFYQHLAPLGKALGLEWGGDWTSFPDYPHYQLTGGLSLAQLRVRHDAEAA